MARKSRELRLTQTKELIAAYEAAGLGNDRNCTFARDMQWRLERKKGLSPKRRQWLDSIIEEGVPTPKNEDRVNAIIAAANLRGMEQKHRFLMDFAGKLRRGWDLSEKQEKWLADMMAQAEKIQAEGIWEPDQALTAKMKIAIAIGSGKNGWYWQHRPGTAKAHDKVKTWLSDPEHNVIEEWACEKLLKAYKKTFEELANPRHEIGSMRYFRGEAGIIADAPFVTDRGVLVYPMLVAGNLQEINAECIGKRRQKR